VLLDVIAPTAKRLEVFFAIATAANNRLNVVNVDIERDSAYGARHTPKAPLNREWDIYGSAFHPRFLGLPLPLLPKLTRLPHFLHS
jgi:hypothetical protein